MAVNDEKASEKLFDDKTAMAMEGNSIRPCDACGAKRARWLCAADSAYLCHACDTSVHTANSVASRHYRVRLTPSAVRYGGLLMDSETSWPHKKTRSERQHKITFLPSLDADNGCPRSLKQNHGDGTELDHQIFLNSESDLFRFEVEDLNLSSFISPGSNNDQYCEGSNPMADGEPPFSWLFDRVKIEESNDGLARVEAEAGPEELFDLNVDLFDLTANFEDKDDEKRKICLTLNYEDVLSAWSDRGSPWTDQNTTERTTGIEYGVVPDLNLNMRSGSCGEQMEQKPVKATHCDRERKYRYCGGREARVLRYREKRRSRLFSKTIRYHVRKLNAEKRPRMKGRFIKTVGNVLSEGIADQNKWS